MFTMATQLTEFIRVSVETKKRLQAYGGMSLTYDDVLSRVLDKCDQYCLINKKEVD